MLNNHAGILNKHNYHDHETSKMFMSWSLFKMLAPAFGGCEAKGMAFIRGEYKEEQTEAMLLGSFVDAYMSGEMTEFVAKNPDIALKSGPNKGCFKEKFNNAFLNAFPIIDNDPTIKAGLEGSKQEIITGELFGMTWKAKIDVYRNGLITDLKYTAEVFGKVWNKELSCFQSTIENYGYFYQLSIYAQLAEQSTGNPHNGQLVVITKETPPDRAVIILPREAMDAKLLTLSHHAERVKQVWKGLAEPAQCGACAYCRKVKKASIYNYKEFEY